MAFWQKLRGDGAALPTPYGSRAIWLAWLGGAITIAVGSLLTDIFLTPLQLASFGASCVLVFGFPELPFSQPRNVILGHFFSSAIGLIFLTLFGPHWISLAVSLGTAIAVMMATRTVHPPAGSNPLIVFDQYAGWSFLLYPTLLGTLIVVIVGLLYNNATRATRYPKYW